MYYIAIENKKDKVIVHLGEKYDPFSKIGEGVDFKSAIADLKSKVKNDSKLLSFVEAGEFELTSNPAHGRYYFG